MNYNHPNKNSSTISIRLMCAIVFLLFSVCWLYFFQAEVLAMTQHVLSGGVTQYHPVLGTIIITVSLMALQLIIFSFIRLKLRTHALTYLPSMLILAILTNVSLDVDGGNIHSLSWWGYVIILLIWLGLIVVSRLYQEVEEDESYHLFSRPMWINVLLMLLMIIGVTWIGNTNAVFQYRMKAEYKLLKGDYDGALKVGKKSLESDENLLMIRMYAMARKDSLGDCLFKYPVTGTSAQILPTDSLSRVMLYPVDSIYKFLGARPARRMQPVHFLECLQRRDTVSNKAVNDYLLCSYLIDRNLDRFAKEIGKYYTVNDSMPNSLPKHYREALVLYTHLRSRPVTVFHESVMDEDYANLKELEKQYPDFMERKGKVEDMYRGTYWFYYDYEK